MKSTAYIITMGLLTMHTFPPVELDYGIIKPKRVAGRVAMVTCYMAA